MSGLHQSLVIPSAEQSADARVREAAAADRERWNDGSRVRAARAAVVAAIVDHGLDRDAALAAIVEGRLAPDGREVPAGEGIARIVASDVWGTGEIERELDHDVRQLRLMRSLGVPPVPRGGDG